MSILFKAMNMTKGIGTFECAIFREKIFRNNEPLAVGLARRYVKTATKNSLQEANQELLRAARYLSIGESGNKVHSSMGGDDLRAFCECKTGQLKKRLYLNPSFGRFDAKSLKKILRICQKEAGRYELEIPIGSNTEINETLVAEIVQQVCHPDWWFRKLRSLQSEKMEAMSIELGLVNLTYGIYASDLIVLKKRSDRLRNIEVMKMVELENELGQIMNLHDLNQTSVANPVIRRKELMTRIAGFQEIAQEQGDVGVFLTLTAPSKYHAYLTKPCKPNPKYQGFNPKETQRYFNGQWKKARAKFNRLNIRPYGFRVVEPHHDGTPHWHLLLFVPLGDKEKLISILREYALEVDGDEKGASKHRCKVVEIDPKKGSAAGYIAKYISKNIDGYKVDDDSYGRDAVESSERILAWASVWRIRQFQQIGGASVTVWREVRRLRGVIPKDLRNKLGIADNTLSELLKAADTGDWKTYIQLMGGVSVARAEQLLRPLYVIKEKCGKYRQDIKKIIGVAGSKVKTLITRPHTWIIRKLIKPIIKSLKQVFVYVGEEKQRSQNLAPLEFCQ